MHGMVRGIAFFSKSNATKGNTGNGLGFEDSGVSFDLK
jgi:hypothetical protein